MFAGLLVSVSELCVCRSLSEQAADLAVQELMQGIGYPANPNADQLQQNNVVLFLGVVWIYLQGNGLANKVARHGQVLAFFFQKQVHDLLSRQNTKFFGIELFGFAQDLAQDFIADSAGRADGTSRLAGGAGLA